MQYSNEFYINNRCSRSDTHFNFSLCIVTDSRFYFNYKIPIRVPTATFTLPLTNVKRLVLGWIAIVAMGANDGYAETSVSQPQEFVKTPYPRIAMLWASVRGDNSLESMARHDLIMAGVGSLGLN